MEITKLVRVMNSYLRAKGIGVRLREVKEVKALMREVQRLMKLNGGRGLSLRDLQDLKRRLELAMRLLESYDRKLAPPTYLERRISLLFKGKKATR